MSKETSLLRKVAEINTRKETNKRDGYTQVFGEQGSFLFHYLVRDSDGKESPHVWYTQVSQLDHFYSVSGYFGDKEEIMTAQEFMDVFAVKGE